MHVEASNIGWLGLIAFSIILGSLLFILLSAILVKPWKPKVTLVVIGPILTLYAAFVSVFLIGGLFFSLFVP